MYDDQLHGRKGKTYYRNTGAGILTAIAAVVIPTGTYFASNGNIEATAIAGVVGAIIAGIGLFASRSHYIQGGRNAETTEGYRWSQRSGAIGKTLAVGVPTAVALAWGFKKFVL